MNENIGTETVTVKIPIKLMGFIRNEIDIGEFFDEEDYILSALREFEKQILDLKIKRQEVFSLED